MTSLSGGLVLMMALAATGRGASAPSPGPGVTVRSLDDRAFPLITIDFEIRGADGASFLDAKREDLRVTEDGRAVEVVDFVPPRSVVVRPTTVVLVADRSGSMAAEGRIIALKQAVATFAEVLPAGSRVQVLAFGSSVRSLTDGFIADPKEIAQSVQPLFPMGGTRFYDAVALALERLAEEPGRRAVVALTDGEDTASEENSLDTVIARARRLGLPVHTVGVGTEEEIAADDLKRLAEETRGQWFPAREADELGRIYEEIARRMGESYTLSYRTDRRLPDGTLRPVEVEYTPTKAAGTAKLLVRGMVVPASGWPGLFLLLVAVLAGLLMLPSWLGRRVISSSIPEAGRTS
jgi:VWFA-related protein